MGSSVYTPQQNVLIERINPALLERAVCMLFNAKLHKYYCAEAVSTAVNITNKISIKGFSRSKTGTNVKW